MPSMRHSHLKNSSRSTAALNLFFGSYIDFVLPERRALRLPAPPREQRGTVLSESGWPTASLRDLPKGAFLPSLPASETCWEASLVAVCCAHRVACSDA